MGICHIDNKPSFGRVLPSFAALLIASFLVINCGESDGDLGPSNEEAVASTTSCYNGCLMRGGTDAQCAEACANIGGQDCYPGCLERGGAEPQCLKACASAQGTECYDGCISRGGDKITCTGACGTGPHDSCYPDCIELGGQATDCQLECDKKHLNRTGPCNDGEKAVRNGVTFTCQDGEWKNLGGLK